MHTLHLPEQVVEQECGSGGNWYLYVINTGGVTDTVPFPPMGPSVAFRQPADL